MAMKYKNVQRRRSSHCNDSTWNVSRNMYHVAETFLQFNYRNNNCRWRRQFFMIMFFPHFCPANQISPFIQRPYLTGRCPSARRANGCMSFVVCCRVICCCLADLAAFLGQRLDAGDRHQCRWAGDSRLRRRWFDDECRRQRRWRRRRHCGRFQDDDYELGNGSFGGPPRAMSEGRHPRRRWGFVRRARISFQVRILRRLGRQPGHHGGRDEWKLSSRHWWALGRQRCSRKRVQQLRKT